MILEGGKYQFWTGRKKKKRNEKTNFGAWGDVDLSLLALASSRVPLVQARV